MFSLLLCCLHTHPRPHQGPPGGHLAGPKRSLSNKSWPVSRPAPTGVPTTSGCSRWPRRPFATWPAICQPSARPCPGSPRPYGLQSGPMPQSSLLLPLHVLVPLPECSSHSPRHQLSQIPLPVTPSRLSPGTQLWDKSPSSLLGHSGAASILGPARWCPPRWPGRAILHVRGAVGALGASWVSLSDKAWFKSTLEQRGPRQVVPLHSLQLLQV